MPRARNVKPGFFKNERLVELPFSTRLLFIGLWTLADRDGRLEDRPKRIKMEVFPADNVDVEQGLAELQAAGFILRYEAEDQRCVQVVNFGKHQNPHVREPASTIPAPGEHQTSPSPTAERNMRQALGEHQSGPAESPLLNPSSLNPESLSQRFSRWWSVYPKKVAKKDAQRAFKKINPDSAMTDRMVAAVESAKKTEQWRRGVIPNPATHLNGQRWEDELGPINGKPAQPAGKPWWETGHGVVVHGADYGLWQKDFKSGADFQAAVYAEARKRGDLPEGVKQ